MRWHDVRLLPQRLAGLVIATGLGWMLLGWARSAWTNHWLLADAQQGVATVLKEHWSGHGNVVYSYFVDHKQYTGVSRRDWRDKRYSNVKPGEQSVVYFSTSHPWISLLHKPDHFFHGWPILIIVFPLEIFALITLIKPTSKWAFDLDDKKDNHLA